MMMGSMTMQEMRERKGGEVTSDQAAAKQRGIVESIVEAARRRMEHGESDGAAVNTMAMAPTPPQFQLDERNSAIGGELQKLSLLVEALSAYGGTMLTTPLSDAISDIAGVTFDLYKLAGGLVADHQQRIDSITADLGAEQGRRDAVADLLGRLNVELQKRRRKSSPVRPLEAELDRMVEWLDHGAVVEELVNVANPDVPDEAAS